MKERGRLEEKESRKKWNAMGREGKKVNAERRRVGGEEEGEREGRYDRKAGKEHQQHPHKFKRPSSLCLCLLHHFLELFPGQCACELLHGGNFSGCHPLQE